MTEKTFSREVRFLWGRYPKKNIHVYIHFKEQLSAKLQGTTRGNSLYRPIERKRRRRVCIIRRQRETVHEVAVLCLCERHLKRQSAFIYPTIARETRPPPPPLRRKGAQSSNGNEVSNGGELAGSRFPESECCGISRARVRQKLVAGNDWQSEKRALAIRAP